MCLLMVTLGTLPKREHLVNASENNPDGYGFAVNHGDRIVTGRSMKYEGLLDRFYAEMAKSDSPVGMFHARYTTHGTTSLDNNHPFRVDGRKDIILAHNGMLPITPRTGDIRSDTRIFAEDVLGSIGIEQLDDKSTFKTLEEFAAGSKIAIMTNAPELRDSIYILNESLGHWDGDIWWSNSTYKTQYTYASYGTGYYGGSSGVYSGEYNTAHIIGKKNWYEFDNDYPTTSKIETVEECKVCTNLVSGDDAMFGVCPVCNSCMDCMEHTHSCMCYSTPASSKSGYMSEIEW